MHDTEPWRRSRRLPFCCGVGTIHWMVLVRYIMSREVWKISESASVAELTSILTRHRITGLPVLDSKGKLVGVVSEFDVIDGGGKPRGEVIPPPAGQERR